MGTGGCVAVRGEERSRGADGGDRRGQHASLGGEAAGGETGPPAADGSREEAGRGHGGEDLRCRYLCTGGTFHALWPCRGDANESEDTLPGVKRVMGQNLAIANKGSSSSK